MQNLTLFVFGEDRPSALLYQSVFTNAFPSNSLFARLMATGKTLNQTGYILR